MYIEYITPPRLYNPPYEFELYRLYHEFRPTWLIRVIDWHKVPGTDAVNGYHALSYCWEQSGEKIQRADGKYDLVDNGYHRITDRDQTLVKRKSRRSVRYRRKRNSRYVTYDELLQKMCKDFGIEYLWYDKICIDQTNKDQKQREIRQMHRIYACAHFTLAMVPEVYVDFTKPFETAPKWLGDLMGGPAGSMMKATVESKWWKRSWTLEETMMSNRLMIVGRNTQMWCENPAYQDRFEYQDLISVQMLGFRNESRRRSRSANTVLRHAHTRTSTKEHDKIFALANIFHGTVSIDIDYDIDVSAVMKHFYRQLAERDLSVMCFGSALTLEDEPKYMTTMASHCLPSWTGTSGKHIIYETRVVVNRTANWVIDDEMRLHITCRSYKLCSIKKHDEHVYEAYMNDHTWPLTTMNTLTGCNPTHYWMTDHSAFHPCRVLPLSLTEDCDECIIPEILFDTTMPGHDYSGNIAFMDDEYYSYLLPVLRKSADTGVYKAVGVVLVKTYYSCNVNYKSPREEFLEKLFSDLNGVTDELIIE